MDHLQRVCEMLGCHEVAEVFVTQQETGANAVDSPFSRRGILMTEKNNRLPNVLTDTHLIAPGRM
jgi:hypothetical protein